MNDTKTLFVSIVGKPNVGKSSLLNSLLGQKIAIVTYKPQTTRTKITGIVTKDNTQFVFVDTPGLHIAKNKLSNHMVNAVNDSILNADISILVVDATSSVTKAEISLIESFKKIKLNVILVINKIDLLPQKEVLMEKIKYYSMLYNFYSIIPISVKKNNGLDIVYSELEKLSKPSIHFFPSDALTDQPEKVIISEIIREKILINTKEEIPHAIAVTVDSMKKNNKNDIFDILCTIYCEKQSHKGIVIGKKGEMLKKIATYARMDIENFLCSKVNLQCWVKVKEDWRNKEQLIKNFGLS